MISALKQVEINIWLPWGSFISLLWDRILHVKWPLDHIMVFGSDFHPWCLVLPPPPPVHLHLSSSISLVQAYSTIPSSFSSTPLEQKLYYLNYFLLPKPKIRIPSKKMPYQAYSTPKELHVVQEWHFVKSNCLLFHLVWSHLVLSLGVGDGRKALSY